MGDYNNSSNDAFMRNNPALQVRPKVAPRQNIQQLKLMGQAHPTGLTSQLLKLFEPRPPLEFKPPPERRKLPSYSGMAQFVSKFAEPGDPEYAPPVQEAETPSQRRARIHVLRLEKGAEKAAEELQKYDPNNDPNVTGDPYKTLFVARLNYETSESRIKREFETYGPIKRVGISKHPVEGSVRLITDTETNKPRGYAFIEFMHTRDMKTAYKQADGRKLDNRRVLVDVERGRTVPNWRPRRLGGGLGTTRVGGEEVNQKNSGREQQQSGPSRSEEPRIREDRHGDREREKSHERVREREKSRERSLERSHDRPRDRDHREDRHHRDRDRNRDRDREKDHGRGRDRTRDRDSRRDRDRGRDYERDRDKDHNREREHDHDRIRPRDREKERDRDYEVEDAEDFGRGRSHDREADFERDRHGEKDQKYDLPEGAEAYYDVRKRSEPDHNYDQYGHASRGDYDNMDSHENDDRYDHEHDQYDPMEDSYNYQSRDYRSSERSHSREYDR